MENTETAEQLVGKRIRTIRRQRGVSLKELSKQSNLNINTLSLIENGKSSPSVGTLQQLAQAFDLPISAFFEADPVQKNVVVVRAGQRPDTIFKNTHLENLGKDFSGAPVQPFVVHLDPGAGSGPKPVIHTGYEFVLCMRGEILYQIENTQYLLSNGDSLLFESHLPHHWENTGEEISSFLLIFYLSDLQDQPSRSHFSHE